ncbi:MAG: Clp protease ClpP [Bacillota bacterium]|nr:Clp protease ClpP [Bacillota bacterium]
MRPKRYFSLHQNVAENSADIYIYGDIVVPEWEWYDSDTSGYSLVKEVEKLEVDTINIFINSYGGHLSEGLAIYNALRRHAAKVRTYCDGYACSAASLVFMAGDERIMSNASILMIHNASSWGVGTAKDLRKVADDNETLSKTAANAYLNHINIDADKLQEMMDAETYIKPEDALEMGFATKITQIETAKVATFSVRESFMQRLTQEPKVVPMAQVTVDGAMVRKIFEEQFEKFKETLSPEEPDEHSEVEPEEPEDGEDPEKNNLENKPLSMMKALFS